MRDRFQSVFEALFELSGRFRTDQAGNYLIMTALLMPPLIGIVGLGTDYGLWTYTQQNMQGAADSASVSGAWAYVQGGTNSANAVQANAVASSYGFANGSNGGSVTVNQPPTSGSYTSQAGAVEVIITGPRIQFFSALYSSNQLTITARAIALGKRSG